jgi:hypothetical protein
MKYLYKTLLAIVMLTGVYQAQAQIVKRIPLCLIV